MCKSLSAVSGAKMHISDLFVSCCFFLDETRARSFYPKFKVQCVWCKSNKHHFNKHHAYREAAVQLGLNLNLIKMLLHFNWNKSSLTQIIFGMLVIDKKLVVTLAWQSCSNLELLPKWLYICIKSKTKESGPEGKRVMLSYCRISRLKVSQRLVVSRRFVFDENMMVVPEPVHGGTAALIKCFDSLNKRAALCAAFYHD